MLTKQTKSLLLWSGVTFLIALFFSGAHDLREHQEIAIGGNLLLSGLGALAMFSIGYLAIRRHNCAK